MVSRFRQRLAGRIERRRDAYAITNRRLFVAPRLPVAVRVLSVRRPAARFSVLQQIEDRRTFHPEGVARPARGYRIARHRLQVVGPGTDVVPGLFSAPVVPVGVGFAAPRQVAICVRRRVRKEVIHALGKAGRGVKRRLPRFNYYSEVIC